MSNLWLEVDIDGLRQTLERKGKSFAIFELVQNAWDESATKVSVTLTKPVNGLSTLKCVDDSPNGYRDLKNAHTMFAKSYKKSDPTKRGRFNVGEKLVLALCDEAQIKSTTGTVVFKRDRTRETVAEATKRGSEFTGKLQLSDAEFEEITSRVRQLIPPITTVYNRQTIPSREPVKTFNATLPTEVADDGGTMKIRQRETQVRLYETLPGETPTLYERGIPVVELQTKWHVDVQQKIPLNIERDNVNPSYQKAICVAVVNEMHEAIQEEDATAPWVRSALANPSISDAAVNTVVKARFGDRVASFDPNDPGANRNATADDVTVVTGGSMSKDEWAQVKRAGAIVPTTKLGYATNLALKLDKIVPPDEYDSDVQKFVRLIETVSPLLLSHSVTVKVVNDKDDKIYGCSQWKKGSYLFTVNIAHQDCSNWEMNFELLLHEAAHHAVQRNDHLFTGFYEAVTMLAAKLGQIALVRPELFAGIPITMPVPAPLVPSKPEEAVEEEEEEAA